MAQATHEAARAVVYFAVKERLVTLVVGGPRGLLANAAGKRQAVHDWRRGQMISALVDKPARAGIDVEVVDERGTSSTCPRCGARVAKPRDTFDLIRLEIMHHRAGRHLPGRTRRDPRRISMDKNRRERVDLWRAVARSETIGESLVRVASAT